MREIRTSGSEGAGPGQPGLATPIRFNQEARSTNLRLRELLHSRGERACLNVKAGANAAH